jgi:hypothetical protein
MTIRQFLDRYGEDTTNNFQLLQYAKELNIKPFKVLMRNELKKLQKTKKNYIICNYQTTNENGTHWICIFEDKNKDTSFYFDSYSIAPFKEAIDFMNDYTYSTFKIQPEGSKMCGQLSMYVLYRLSQGFDFYSTVLEMSDYLNS